jgi:hypothetical protein
MHTLIRFRLTALGLVALSALLALPGGPAAAKSDKVIREDYADSFNTDLCGLNVDVDVAGTFRATIHVYVIGPNQPPADDFWIGNINDHGGATITNTANGKTVVQTWINNIKEAGLVDLGGGYWQYTFAQSGIPVRLGGGKPIDVGRIVITQTIYFGDLSTGDDDVFYPGIALSDSGRHPAFYSEKPFCDALLKAIG